jgi:hypothetical protein
MAVAWSSASLADTVQIRPSLDNSIYSERENSNALGRLYAGATPPGNLRRALLKFDIAGSGIPSGSVINSVTLSLTLTKIGPADAGPALFELRPLLSAWGAGTSIGIGAGGSPTPGDATWNYRLYNTSSWTTPGGDYGFASGTANIGTTVGATYTFASQPGLVANVQSWFDLPGSNFGWILKAADETPGLYATAREFGSSESPLAEQPTLTVNYTPLTPPSVSLRIESVPAQAGQVNLIFSPVIPGYAYTVETSPDLTPASWMPLVGGIPSDDGQTRTVTDPNASGARKFYRLVVGLLPGVTQTTRDLKWTSGNGVEKP